jgi:hypothetical protein
MKTLILTAIAGAFNLAALAQPASACPRGYHTAWIKGYPICTLNTPNLPLKAKR